MNPRSPTHPSFATAIEHHDPLHARDFTYAIITPAWTIVTYGRNVNYLMANNPIIQTVNNVLLGLKGLTRVETPEEREAWERAYYNAPY